IPHPAEVDQQCPVAHAPARPAVTSGAHRHLPATLAGQTHAVDYVLVARRLQHPGRHPLARMANVGHRAKARLVEPGVVVQQQLHTITDCPPSTTMSIALRYAASSDARNKATRATSSGRPSRPSGCDAAIACIGCDGSSKKCAICGVTISPGLIELARML